MRDLVRKNDMEVQINLEKLAKLLNLKYDYVLEKLNELIKIDFNIEGYIIDWEEDGIYLCKDGLIILLPFLKIEDSEKTLFAILNLIYDMDRQESKVNRKETKRITNVAYKEIKDYLDKKINQKKI